MIKKTKKLTEDIEMLLHFNSERTNNENEDENSNEDDNNMLDNQLQNNANQIDDKKEIHSKFKCLRDLLLNNMNKFSLGTTSSIRILFIINVIVIVWMLSLTAYNLNYSTNKSAVSSNKLIKSMSITSLTNGKTALDLNTDVIRFLKPNSFAITEIVKNTVRTWSTKYIKVYVDDVVSWVWETNENIVSCDANGAILHDSKYDLYSGPLNGPGGKYSYHFLKAGTYYYTSQNSESMNGAVVVMDQPSLTTMRAVTGAVPLVPLGIQKDLSEQTINQIDGCWQTCAEYKLGEATPATEEMLKQCSGDFLYFGIKNLLTNNYIVGAFGDKKKMFSFTDTYANYGADYSVKTSASNKVNWYKFDIPSQYGYASIGFTNQDISVYWRYKMVGRSSNCQDSMGWGIGPTSYTWTLYAIDGVCYDLSPDSQESNHLKRVVLTNTCPLFYPLF